MENPKIHVPNHQPDHYYITKRNHDYITTIWLFNIAMENPPIFKNGKPSISMGHLYHGYVNHIQRVFID